MINANRNSGVNTAQHSNGSPHLTHKDNDCKYGEHRVRPPHRPKSQLTSISNSQQSDQVISRRECRISCSHQHERNSQKTVPTARQVTFLTLLTAAHFLTPGAMAASSQSTTDLAPQSRIGSGGNVHFNCNQETQLIQNQLNHCHGNLTAKAHDFGQCKGRLESDCNIALANMDKTTAHTFCKSEVTSNQTAASQICTPVNTQLSQCQQDQAQCQQDQQSLAQCRQQHENAMSLEGHFTQFQEQIQEQSQKQEQSVTLGLGLGGGLGALVGAGALAAGYACGKSKGKREGYQQGLKQANKLQKGMEKSRLRQFEQEMRRTTKSTPCHSPVVTRTRGHSFSHV